MGRFVCFRLKGDDVFADIGRYVERVVFQKAFGNDADTMGEEYGPYEGASTFFISVDTAGRSPAGVLRVIADSSASLKTINDLSGDPLHITRDRIFAAHGLKDLTRC
jgi:hypothetical protein